MTATGKHIDASFSFVPRGIAERERDHDGDNKDEHKAWCEHRGLVQRTDLGALFAETQATYYEVPAYFELEAAIRDISFLNSTEKYMLFAAGLIAANKSELEEDSILKDLTLEPHSQAREVVLRECYSFFGEVVSGSVWPEVGSKSTLISRMKIIQALERQIHEAPTSLTLAALSFLDTLEEIDSKKANGDSKAEPAKDSSNHIL